jgi:hypothetical protein
MTPNVGGNRRADEALAEDQVVCRRVRLTVRLGRDVDVADGAGRLGNGQAVLA